MKENSIEETIKQLKLILKIRKEQKEIIECAGGSCMNCDPDIKALSKSIEILSDYKRVLKENEELKNNTRKNEQNSLEFDVDGDWAELKKILNKSRKTNEYIMYKGEKWIKEKYCIPIQKVKYIIKELNIDIERNKRRKIQNNEDGSLQMEMIAYDPAIIKMRLLKLLESE